MTRLTRLSLALATGALLALGGCSPSETADDAKAALDKAATTAQKTLGDAADAAQETLGDASDAAQRKLGDAAASAEKTLGDAAATAERKLADASAATGEALGTAAEKAEQAAARAERAAKDQLSRVDAPAADAQGGNKEGAAAQAGAGAGAAFAALIAEGDRLFQPGKDYVLLTPAKRTSSPPEKVELTEVFMYQCPHCFSFEPFIDNVVEEMPPEVNFVRLPAIFNPVAKLHAQVFYAAKSLGVHDRLHTPFFREIHTRRNLMPTEAKVLDFVESQGIDRAEFAKALKSFEVDSKVRDALDLNGAYRIESVPTLVVNGKYVTSGSMAGSTARLRQILDYLVAKEAAAL